jgi:hypothetical protein
LAFSDSGRSIPQIRTSAGCIGVGNLTVRTPFPLLHPENEFKNFKSIFEPKKSIFNIFEFKNSKFPYFRHRIHSSRANPNPKILEIVFRTGNFKKSGWIR